MSVLQASIQLTLPASPFPPLAVGFMGLGTCCHCERRPRPLQTSEGVEFPGLYSGDEGSPFNLVEDKDRS